MKTAKINEVYDITGDGVKWNGNYYHNLLMDNGEKINIGKKKKMERGQEISYELTGEDDGQQEFKKAKPVNPNWNGGGGGGKGDLKGIKIGHAITNGVALYNAHGESAEGKGIRDSIKDYSKLIYQISEELNQEL